MVREFQFVHPHPMLLLDVRGADGKTVTWRAEMDNRFELEEIGMRRRHIQAGRRGGRQRQPGPVSREHLYLWKLVRPSDRLRYEQVGTTPYLTRGGAQAVR